MSIKNLKSLARNLGLFVASAMLSLLLAEWSVRTLYPQQLAVWYTTEDGLVIHPPGLITYLTESKQEIRFNASGMRDRDHAKKKQKDTTRILVFGDSFMEALQVAFEDSFPSLLESGLRKALHRNVEVINCAVSGWGQDDQLAYLQKYGRALEPDLILVAMTLHNDVSDNMREQFHTLAHDKLILKPVAHMSVSELKILHVKSFFASHSHLWQLLRKVKSLREMRSVAAALSEHVMQLIGRNETEELKRGWKLTFELFKGIREVGKSMGAGTAIMLIPLRLQLQDDALDGFRTFVGMSTDDVAIERPQQAMRTFGREANIEIIDLLPTLRRWTVENKASLHLQDGHWNEKGHRLAADTVVKEIVEKRLVTVIPSSSSLMPMGNDCKQTEFTSCSPPAR